VVVQVQVVDDVRVSMLVGSSEDPVDQGVVVPFEVKGIVVVTQDSL
jgi:hypothetical protein